MSALGWLPSCRAGFRARPGRSLALLLGLSLLACAGPGACRTAPPAATRAVPPSGEEYDLERDERLGGHTLSRHVGRSPAELAERLRRERSLRTASTFPDRATAERAVARALSTQGERVTGWTRRGARRPNLALTVRSPDGRPFGLTLSRGDETPRQAIAARVVLRARDTDFFVLTAYPTEER